MAEERSIPRRADRGLGYAPSINPSPLVQTSQLMAPPAPAAQVPSDNNELLQVAESLKGLNAQLGAFSLAYTRNDAIQAKNEGEADANSDPEKARQVLRMGYQNAVKAGILKESANPMYWRSYMTNSAKNIVEPGFRAYLYEKYLPKASDPKNTDPIESMYQEAWQSYQKDSGFNLDSPFAKAAANESSSGVFKTFSTSALSKRLEAREIDARNQLGIGIQRGLKEAENLSSEQANEAIVNSFVKQVGDASMSGMSNATYYALQTGVAPYIDQLRRVNPDKAMAILQTLKEIKLPNGYVVSEGNTLPLFNQMEENVIAAQNQNANRGQAERGQILTAAQDKVFEIMDRFPNINDPKAVDDIAAELIASNVALTGDDGKKELVPLNGYNHLHGSIKETVRKLVNERRSSEAQPNANHMNAFNLAVVNNDVAEARRIYDAGQESGFNGTNQAKMLEAIQTLENYEPLMKTRSAQEARAIITNTLATEFKTSPIGSEGVVGMVDLEFNKAIKEEMDAYLQDNPGKTQEQSAPAVMRLVQEKVLDRVRKFGNNEIQNTELAQKRDDEVRKRNEELKNKDAATSGPSWFTFDELTRVSRERAVVRNFIELGRASRTGLAPADQEAVQRKLQYVDSKIGTMVDRLAGEVNRKFETKYYLPMSEMEPAQPYESPKTAEKTQADLERYYSAKAVKGYSPAEIMANQTDHNIPIDPNLNPLLTPVFTSVEELANFRIAYRKGDQTALNFVKTLKIRDIEQFATAQALAVESLGRGKRR